MKYLTYERINTKELSNISKMLSLSYKQTYKDLMSDAYLSTITDEYWISILQHSISKGDICLVAKDHDVIVGTAVFGNAENHDSLPMKCAMLHAFYLSFDYIGKGIGHAFYCVIETTMKSLGYDTCILEVLSSNQRAIKFYLQQGFQRISTFQVEENGIQLQCDMMKKTI